MLISYVRLDHTLHSFNYGSVVLWYYMNVTADENDD